MSEGFREHVRPKMCEEFWVDLHTGSVPYSQASVMLLNESRQEWHDLFHVCRRALGRPEVSGYTDLLNLTLHPYAELEKRLPVLALTGLFRVYSHVKLSNAEVIPVTTLAPQHEVIVMDIDTHGGNFDYMTGILAEGNGRSLELSETVSTHVAMVMHDFYRSLP